jgi:hypothetical protein
MILFLIILSLILVVLYFVVWTSILELPGFINKTAFFISIDMILLSLISIIYQDYFSKEPFAIFKRKIYLPSFLFFHKLIIYFTFFCIVYTTSKSILSIVGFGTTDPESARYLLSTLVGSEVTVLAMIVTLSLVVVQLTIPYTPKVSRIFRNPITNPDFFIFFTFYFVSIIYSAWVLMQLRGDGNGGIKNFDIHSVLH